MNKVRNSLAKNLLVIMLVLLIGAVFIMPAYHAIASNPNEETITQAATTEKIIVSLSNDTSSWTDDTLYTLNPTDGSNKTPLFDFHGQPKITTGEIYAPRVSADGTQIYFHSEHAYIYTPARRNLFRVATMSNALDQITPSPNSGIWNQTGNSTVSGQVQYGDGTPWSNAPVYLEGMDMVYSGGDGTFSFQNVPSGARWLVAYRPTLDAFEAQSLTVVSGVNTTGLTLQPNNTGRMNFENPAMFNNRIYYQFNREIQWTTADFSPPQTVYTSPTDACTGIPTVDAFDAGRVTGKMAVYDYQTGCGVGNYNHNGIYTLDKDGNNKQLLINMLADSNWDEPFTPVQLFWSPNENRLAIKASYAGYDYLLVYDTNGVLTGSAYADTSSEILTLHGWSPDGNWLLYSQYDGNPAQATLGKIGVNADGSLDNASITTLLVNQPIHGATWGNLAVTQKVFLPAIIR